MSFPQFDCVIGSSGGLRPKAASERVATAGGAAVFVGIGLVMATHAARSLAHPSGLIASVLLGSLPNFGAGLALPFVVTNAQQYLGKRPWATALRFTAVCSGVVAVLALWEYVQLEIWRYPFDSIDIAASGAGAVLASLVAVRLRARRASLRD